MKERWTLFSDGLQGLALAFEWWRDLLSTPRSSVYFYSERADFWQELNDGWMSMYICPYDDLYHPTLSDERKLRLGAR